MSVIQILFATIVTLGLLVTVHEYGHFWVARKCGIKVLRFSVGFGKALFTRVDRHGTEFVIAAIPLGGYVKMLDEREAEVAQEDLPFAFNRQSVGKRIAVVVAGPAANFAFAIFAYWLLFVVGVTTLVPVVGAVAPDSIAALAGIDEKEEIISIDGAATATWQALNVQLLGYVGETREISLITRPIGPQSDQREYLLVLRNWLAGEERPDPIKSLGITPYLPDIPATVGQVEPQGAGARAGLAPGDRVRRIAGTHVYYWPELVQQVQSNPGKTVMVEIERDGTILEFRVQPDEKILEDGTTIGYLGVAAMPVPWPEELTREIKYSIFGAWVPALEKTWDMTVLTLVSLKKMLVGLISIKNLSGPITIAKVAGASVDKGAETFLNFLAYLSISLGLINILPIPVLDGGHLMYYLVELVRGRPVSEKIQGMGLRIGMSIILALMVLAIYNDLTRL